jgi:hypothetical protein
LRRTDGPDGLIAVRRELLRDAIADIQGSIRANDGKSSAALLVHGLLFAGIVTVTAEIVAVYVEAAAWQQVVMLVALGSGLIAFVVSVWYLTRAVTPYHPSELRRRIERRHPKLFFPLLHDLREESERECTDELTVYMEKLQVADSRDIEADYGAELIKLADVRRYEARCARIGYRWLRIELVLVATYLVFVASVGLTHLA